MEFSERPVGVISSFCPYTKSDSGPGSFSIDHRIHKCIYNDDGFCDLNMITSPCMYNSIRSLRLESSRVPQELPTMENKKKIEDDDQVCWKHHDDGLKEEEEEEESEEMKMEKFYSLIRNYHEARKRLRLRNATRPPPPPQVHSDDHEVFSDNKVNSNKRRKKMGGDDEDAGGRGGGGKIWVPSFEVGDFANEVEFRGSLCSCNNIITGTASTASIASTAEQKQDDGKNESLDLKLTL